MKYLRCSFSGVNNKNKNRQDKNFTWNQSNKLSNVKEKTQTLVYGYSKLKIEFEYFLLARLLLHFNLKQLINSFTYKRRLASMQHQTLFAHCHTQQYYFVYNIQLKWQKVWCENETKRNMLLAKRTKTEEKMLEIILISTIERNIQKRYIKKRRHFKPLKHNVCLFTTT